MSAFTPDGYRVASEEELFEYAATLCQMCNGEPRKAASFDELLPFCGDPEDMLCLPCALWDWGCRLLTGDTPPASDPDRTLRTREMTLLIFASWMLRRPVVR